MNFWRQWGFTPDSWKGQRGEYWVLAQMVLLGVYVVLPRYQPFPPAHIPLGWRYGAMGLAGGITLLATLLLGKGLLDLGQNLTPLPYPREDGELVQTGVYGWVRHSLYSGLILGTFGLGLGQFSLSHIAVSFALFGVLNAKANQEEVWLQERYPEYQDYRQRVKKLIPWVF
ncbi:protein-S-isoprenylcysteine methyltransferase [Leptolyngbya sp. BL0902]|uniref:methyltransferase family protein n=1 Tax=Leptolyngbya sp. BL0902 TaxID=1115757 RepID=UPI0018E838B9|nr:isoprenylcysteine carboxylmethyltransferase family protein [Leptolyngbya sp. BL0902]QQE65449.1 protein-S-isoprenylcysteine methyltransferase [Leptolyngbya sp. BL0902]